MSLVFFGLEGSPLTLEQSPRLVPLEKVICMSQGQGAGFEMMWDLSTSFLKHMLGGGVPIS